ncbi:MAG TPA: hypothetical protein VGR92_14745 [Steroidobacteraceae bacterium]|nr:hypothetical protein [Steroidobacteraceae bacterium]
MDRPARPDIAVDPFRERGTKLLRLSLSLLGGRFEFQTASREFMRLVRWAYANLPAHRMSTAAPRYAIRLVLGDSDAARHAHEPAPLTMLSGAGLLCGASPSVSAAIVSAEQRTGLVIAARDMLRFPYHLRYELIEFAVFTLAQRVQGLIPLHAACVGSGRRGILLIGGSGAGKSTAVLHCALAGLDLLSEDSLFVAPRSLLATGVANFLHVRAESLRFLSSRDAALLRRSPTIRRRSGVEKLEVDLRQRRFRLARAPLEVVGVVDLTRRLARGGPLLTRLGTRELLQRLRASQPYAASQPGWRTFVQRIRAVPAFELRRGRHPRETAQALRQLLSEGGSARR